jgi:predicted RNA-binding protein with RPS1 domain
MGDIGGKKSQQNNRYQNVLERFHRKALDPLSDILADLGWPQDQETIEVPDIKFEDVLPYKTGDFTKGQIVKIENFGVFAEIGLKAPVFIPNDQLSMKPVSHATDIVQFGQHVVIEIIGILKRKSVYVGSLKFPEVQEAWRKVEEASEKKVTVNATVTDINRNGCICKVFGLKAYLPGSQLIPKLDKSLVRKTIPVSSIIFMYRLQTNSAYYWIYELYLGQNFKLWSLNR